MSDHVTEIKKLIQPVFDEAGVFLVELSLKGAAGSKVLHVLVDTISGISLKQITALTRGISEILDFSDIISDRYRLEVSSPGLDRPLTETWQFEKNIGRQLHVDVEIDAEPIAYEGQLLSVDDNMIQLQVQKNKLAIDRADIVKARIKLKW